MQEIWLQEFGWDDPLSERLVELYLRVEFYGQISTHLNAAKKRVAPVKTVSLPRLELSDGVLLSEFSAAIIPQLPVRRFQCYQWTDSTIVLAWIDKPVCK